MPEQKSQIKTYAIRYICDECESGYMEMTGKSGTFHDKKWYEHKCTHCDSIMDFYDVRYPKIVHETDQ